MGYGYDNLSKKRFNFEKESEMFMIRTFDVIITVNDVMTEYFSQLDNKTCCKFVTVKNGFDPEDMKLPNKYKLKDINKLVFVYVGSFHPKTFHNLTRKRI